MEFTLEYFKHVCVNALVWTGALAIGLTLLNRDFSLLVFFVSVAVFSAVVAFALQAFSPTGQARKTSGDSASFSELAFTLSPVDYPKVLDSETRQYAPEFIKFDIKREGDLVFRANMRRDSLRGLRDAFSQVLTSSPVQHPAAPSIKVKK